MIPEWLEATGPPWWALIAALLTDPSTWSEKATKLARSRIPGLGADE